MVSPRQLYLSIYVLFFRLVRGAWPAAMRAEAYNGAFGITLLGFFLFVTVGIWLELLTGSTLFLMGYVLFPFSMLLFAGNVFFLIKKGYGTEFESEFTNMPDKKRKTLKALATSIVVGVVALFVYSLTLYMK